MRWIFLCFALAMPSATWAFQWKCDGALAVTDLRLGHSDTQFRLALNDDGRFRAERGAINAPWGWSGTWTTIDDQIAMIGPTIQAWPNPMNKLDAKADRDELRGFSSVYEDDVIVLNLISSDAVRLVRCLREEH